MSHPTHTITCHYEDSTGEHAIDVTLYRDGLGPKDWIIETDLSEVPDDELASVKQQAIDGYCEAEARAYSDDDRGPGTPSHQAVERARALRPGRRKGDKSGKHTQTQVNLRADEDEVERWTLAAARSRMDRNSFLRFAASQLADKVLGKDG